MGPGEYLKQAYLRPVLCALPVAAIAYAFWRLDTTSWWRFAAEGISICSVFGVLTYFLCLYSEQRAAVAARLAQLFRPAPASSEV
jgi:hypothetical protein